MQIHRCEWKRRNEHMNRGMILRNKLFNFGFIPDDAFSAELKEEGAVYQSGVVKLDAKFEFFDLKHKLKTKGLIIVTNKRLVAVLYYMNQYFVFVNTPLEHEYFTLLEISKSGNFTILIDYKKFPGDSSGKIRLEYQVDPSAVPI